MKGALFLVETNADTPNQAARNFAAGVMAPDQRAGALGLTQISHGAFYCDLSKGLDGLALLNHFAKGYDLASRTLFFEKDPVWVTSSAGLPGDR